MIRRLINEFISHLNQETEFDESRRRVIKGAAALAALAALPSFGVDGFVNFSAKDFERMVSNGVVEDVTFYLDRTVSIEMDNLIIRNCKFISVDGFRGDTMIYIKESSGVEIRDCYLDSGNVTGSAITFDGNSDNIGNFTL